MRAWVACSALLLVGCATTTPAPVVVPPLPPEPVVEAPAPVQVPSDLPMLMASEPLVEVSAAESQAAVSWATRRALLRPQRQWFREGVLVYPYRPGMIYAIPTTKQQGTDIFFAPGERLVSIPGADDWWQVDPIQAEDAQGQARVIVAPKEAGKQTRLTIVTSKGPYYLHLSSSANPGLVGVTWRHQEKVQVQTAKSDVYRVGLAILVKKGSPTWTPLAAWEYEGQTHLKANPEMAHGLAPSVYIRRGKERHLVNWQLVNGIIKIEQSAQVIELLSGYQDAQEIVQVVRTPAYTAIRCPGDGRCP